MTRSQILNDILSQTAKNPKQTLHVFDLDSTLFDVTPRIKKVIENFAADPEYQKLFPDSIVALKDVVLQKEDWGIKDALMRHGFATHSEDFHSAIRGFWKTKFFSDEYLHFDEEIEGASEFVRKLHEIGSRIVYLTGRDVERMGKGSVEVLNKWNFPIGGDRAELVLKPKKGMDDAKFKSDWFKTVARTQYSHIWFFENEPHNIELARQEHPDVKIIFIDTQHSGRAEAPTDLPVISSFKN